MRKLFILLVLFIGLVSCSDSPTTENSVDELTINQFHEIEQLKKDTVVIAFDDNNCRFWHYENNKIVYVSELSKTDGMYSVVLLREFIIVAIVLLVFGFLIGIIINKEFN